MRRFLLLGLGVVGCAEAPEPADAPRPPPMGLSVRGLAPGGLVTFDVSGAVPGGTVYVGGSTVGPGTGPCPPQLGGLCLGVLSPTLLATTSADGAGQATVTVRAPAALPRVWLQAAAAAGPASRVSNVVTNAVRGVADLGPGDLVITELLKDPFAVDDAVGEWVEVFNPGPGAVDLGGLVLADLDGEAFTVPGPLVVDEGAHVVFGASADPAVNGGAPVDVAWSGYTLGNGYDEVVLRVGAVVIDQVVYEAGWSDPVGASLSLDPAYRDARSNDAPGAWCVAGWSFGVGDDGSPGAPNPACGTTGGCVVGDDLDDDGWLDCEDCDDLDPRTHPGAAEVCDGVDNDCDGQPGASEVDADGDDLPDCDVCGEAGYGGVSPTLTGAALEVALRAIASQQACDDYPLERAFQFVVLHKDPAGIVEGVYTGVRRAVGATEPDPSVLNTEHAWPQSQGSDVNPARCDLHHLFPSDPDANLARGALPFGDVVRDVTWSEGGSSRGDDASGTVVFEPRDARKGDIARAMLYMSTRHQLPLTAARRAVFRAWHLQDPVDPAELRRTLIVKDRQGAANPYVACPELVGRL